MLRRPIGSLLRNRVPPHAAAAAASSAMPNTNTAANGQQQQQSARRPSYAVPRETIRSFEGSAERPVAKISLKVVASKAAYQAWRKMMDISRRYFPDMVDGKGR